MKAIIHPRIRLENRPVLEDHIPLDVPFVINVDPSDKCNLSCRFCPTGDHDLMKRTSGRNHGPMKLDLFKKIIDDICQFPRPIKVLRLYKEGEPFANPNFAEMVRYAKQSGCCKVVDTTTNGVLLSPKRNLEIIEAGLDRLNVSVYGMTSDQYERFSGRKVDVQDLTETIRHFYENSRGKCVINVKINSDVISPEETRSFYEIFGEICDEINDEHVMACWPEFDFDAHGVEVNSQLDIYGEPLKGEVLVCPYIFYSFSINSDGTASACFLDWERRLLIGDAKKQSVPEIWKGIQLAAHQQMMLKGERKNHPICGNCGQMSHGRPDNIDAHRERLSKLVQISVSQSTKR